MKASARYTDRDEKERADGYSAGEYREAERAVTSGPHGISATVGRGDLRRW
jgi:hypothetical protein